MKELDPRQVAEFLVDAEEVEAIRHGEWSTAFHFRRGDRQYVVRFSATDDDFFKDQRAFQYASAELPTPRIVDMGQAFGGFYAISERAYGDFLEARDEQSMRRVLPSLLATLDVVRQVDVSDTSGLGLWTGRSGDAPHPTWQSALLAIRRLATESRVGGSVCRKHPTATGCSRPGIGS